jgi:hypothetical protein
MVVIEIVERETAEGNTSVIAECNLYEGDVMVRQYSRSPFVFQGEWTDEQIILYLKENDYKQYFA